MAKGAPIVAIMALSHMTMPHMTVPSMIVPDMAMTAMRPDRRVIVMRRVHVSPTMAEAARAWQTGITNW